MSNSDRVTALVGNEMRSIVLRSDESLYLNPTLGENVERITGKLSDSGSIRQPKCLRDSSDSDSFYLLDEGNTLYKMDTNGNVIWKSLIGIFDDRDNEIRIDKKGRPYAWQQKGLIRLDKDTGSVQLLFGNKEKNIGRPYATFSNANDKNEGNFAFRPSPNIVLGLDNTETYIRTWETKHEYDFTDIQRRDRLEVADVNGFTTNVRSWSITDDGSRILVHGYSDNQIAQYTLSEPFEVSTASHDVTLTKPFGIDSNGSPTEFIIGADMRDEGNLLFVHVRNEDNNTYKLYKFDLSTPYDIESATNKVSATFGSPSVGRRKATVTRDGEYIYLDNQDISSDKNGGRVKLDVPFDITGTFTDELTGLRYISLPNTRDGVRFWCRGEQNIRYIAEKSISQTRYDSDSPIKRSNIEQITTNSKGDYYLQLRTFNSVDNYVIDGVSLKDESYNLIKVDEDFSNPEFVFRGGNGNDIGNTEVDRHRFKQLDILPGHDDFLLGFDNTGKQRLYELQSSTTTRQDKEIREMSFTPKGESYDVGYHPDLDEPVWAVPDNGYIRVFVGIDGIRDTDEFTFLEYPRSRQKDTSVRGFRVNSWGGIEAKVDLGFPLDQHLIYEWGDDPQRYGSPIVSSQFVEKNPLKNLVVTEMKELIAPTRREQALLKSSLVDSQAVYQVNVVKDGGVQVQNDNVDASSFRVKTPVRINVSNRSRFDIMRVK